jgi:hypothetical protein
MPEILFKATSCHLINKKPLMQSYIAAPQQWGDILTAATTVDTPDNPIIHAVTGIVQSVS